MMERKVNPVWLVAGLLLATLPARAQTAPALPPVPAPQQGPGVLVDQAIAVVNGGPDP